MTHVQIKGSKFTITKEGSSSYESWFRSTLDYLIERLDLKSITLGGKDFNFLEALPLRFIKDNDLIELDRSLEIRIDSNNVLYLDCILGSLMLKQLSSANDFKKIANKLGKLHLVIDKDNPKVYIAETTIHGYTLPERSSKKNTQTVIDATKNLPYEIFNGQISDYNLARITTKAMILEFSSKAIEESNDTEETETVVISSIDEDNTSEAYTTANNDVAEKKVEAVVPTEGTETDLTNKTAPSTEVNNGRIKIISGSSSLSSPIKGSITIGNNSKKGDPKTHITLNPSDSEEVSTSTSDDVQHLEVALPTQTLSWSQLTYGYVKYSANWAYDNILPIAGTIACVGAGCFIYYYNQPMLDSNELTIEDRARVDAGWSREIDPQDDWIENSELSISEQISDAGSNIIESAKDKFNEFSFNIAASPIGKLAGLSPYRDFPEGFGDTPEMDLADRLMCTPQASRTIAARTAQKVQHVVRFLDQEQQILNEAAKLFVKHFKVKTSPWLANGGKQVLEQYVKNFFQDTSNIENLPAIAIKAKLLENFRSDDTLDQEDFLRIIENIGKNINGATFTFQDAVRDLRIQTVFGEIEDPQAMQTAANGLLADILNQGSNKYILYVAIMAVFPFVNSEEENPEEFLNNNATEWHSLSMVTEADFDNEEDSEDYVVYYNNTHPQLALKAFSQAIEDSYKNQDNLELNFISDTGIQCRSVLNNAIEILGDTLYLTAQITKGSNPLVTLFNNFYAIPALYSNVDSICDSIEEPLDNAYLAAEESYDSALVLLGIEASA